MRQVYPLSLSSFLDRYYLYPFRNHGRWSVSELHIGEARALFGVPLLDGTFGGCTDGVLAPPPNTLLSERLPHSPRLEPTTVRFSSAFRSTRSCCHPLTVENSPSIHAQAARLTPACFLLNWTFMHCQHPFSPVHRVFQPTQKKPPFLTGAKTHRAYPEPMCI